MEYLRYTRDLTRSVKAIGVRVPTVVVRGEGDGYLLLYGQRRHAAAIAAGQPLPALVTEDVDEAERIVNQLVENQHRKDLTPGEEGAAYEQLSVLGMSDAAIAKRTGTTKRRVQSARQVAGSDVASAVAHRYALDLEQAAVVAEFADDAQAVKTLTGTAKDKPGRFPHVASRLRQDRERVQQWAATAEALAAAGVTVLESSRDHPTATPLWNLCDGEDDAEITPELHSGLPRPRRRGAASTLLAARATSASTPTPTVNRNRYGDNPRPAGGRRPTSRRSSDAWSSRTTSSGAPPSRCAATTSAACWPARRPPRAPSAARSARSSPPPSGWVTARRDPR
ncbi:MAG: ParB/RepB/Spo0J family partition protein [Actinomycetota bacterium]|nr:ParB/RepB/Spo0J family partition protein [Actinomycetota bacterium]